jgi:hypothetical protein
MWERDEKEKSPLNQIISSNRFFQTRNFTENKYIYHVHLPYN